jgi:hypothetical protein
MKKKTSRWFCLALALLIVLSFIVFSWTNQNENVLIGQEARAELSALCEEQAPALEVEAEEKIELPSMKEAFGLKDSERELTQVCMLEVSDGESKPSTRFIQEVEKLETFFVQGSSLKKFREVYFTNEATGELHGYFIIRFVRVENE